MAHNVTVLYILNIFKKSVIFVIALLSGSLMIFPMKISYFAGSEKELPKVWNKKETQLLFHARMKLEKEFSEARSHKTLWDKIAKELKSAGCLVTARQCENKYKSLKREYRATIDHNSRSGNDRKSCAFFEEFSELYGMKAGSRPKFTIGSFSGSDRSQMQESFSSSD